MKYQKIIPLKTNENWLHKMLNWANSFNIFCFTTSNNFLNTWCVPAQAVLAVDSVKHIHASNTFDAFLQLELAENKQFTWFAANPYNSLQNAYTNQTLARETPPLVLFAPKYLISFFADHILIQSNQSIEKIIEQIEQIDIEKTPNQFAQIIPTFTQAQYIQRVANIKQQLQLGNAYEVNFCNQFTVTNACINVIQTFLKLNAQTKAPYAALFKTSPTHYIISASPEQFFNLNDSGVISTTPMKGTAKRSNNKTLDAKLKYSLKNSVKERAENTIVVDLARNDFSKIAEPHTVQVTSLCDIITLPNVYQMISEVQCKKKSDVNLADIWQATFPMASMTGAPKKNVMHIIEQTEGFNRGYFSGSIGIIKPNGKATFNVLIRSIFYNTLQQQATIGVGSGITVYANAEDEYIECLLKAEALLNVL